MSSVTGQLSCISIPALTLRRCKWGQDDILLLYILSRSPKEDFCLDKCNQHFLYWGISPGAHPDQSPCKKSFKQQQLSEGRVYTSVSLDRSQPGGPPRGHFLGLPLQQDSPSLLKIFSFFMYKDTCLCPSHLSLDINWSPVGASISLRKEQGVCCGWDQGVEQRAVLPRGDECWRAVSHVLRSFRVILSSAASWCYS